MSRSSLRGSIISGIGGSEIARPSTLTDLELTIQSCMAAVDDAGLALTDIDGLIVWPGDAIGKTGGMAPASPGFSGPSAHLMKDVMRLKLNWHYAGSETPGMLAAVIHACMAVSTGTCRHVLVYRTMTEASVQKGGRRVADAAGETDARGPVNQWMLPYGSYSGANWMGTMARRHFHKYGTTLVRQLAWIPINNRRNSALNPRGIYRDPISLDDYMGVRMISDPLCLYDCDVPVYGSVAVVVSAADTATDLRNPAIRVESIGVARSWAHAVGYAG